MDFSRVAVFSFGDGSLAYRSAAKRVAAQASYLHPSIAAIAFHKQDLIRGYSADSQLIEWHNRGFGFWKWKPLALRLALDVLPRSIDYLIYADAGCWIHKSAAALLRLEEYLDGVSKHGSLTFSSGEGNTEEKFTKMELLDFMSASTADRATTQRAATLWILERNVAADFVGEWWKIANTKDLITDKLKPSIQSPIFIDHRHDQSIFSLIAKRRGFPLSVDNIDIHPAHTEIGPLEDSIPFWAARHRSGFRSLSMNPVARGARFIEQKIR